MKRMVFNLDAGSWHGSATETVWVEPLESGNYRVENSPFYAFGVSYMDIVGGIDDDGLLIFDGVISRGGHSTYRIIKSSEGGNSFANYWVPLQQIGCTYEEGLNGLLSVDIPPEIDIFLAYELLERGENAGVWSFEEAHCGHATGKD